MKNSEKQLNSINSKIGGKPFLPSDFKWFRNGSEDNKALSFIAQINLSEIKSFDKLYVSCIFVWISS